MAASVGNVAELVGSNEQTILPDWVELQKKAGTLQTGRITEAELISQSRDFLHLLRDGLAKGGTDAANSAYGPAKQLLTDVSRARAIQGFSPSETATFVFSLKQPLFNTLTRTNALSPAQVADLTWSITVLLDKLGLYTTEVYQKSREEVIIRQQQEMLELSTPVVKLWDGILALPMIGTLDSARTQVVMETLLQSIVETGAEIAIIDITGVPTVDTLTAQHLLKTVTAARLMGADCIISGIRPQIAQTIVHLGVDLNVITKATLADAFAIALERTGRMVTEVRPQSDRQGPRREGPVPWTAFRSCKLGNSLLVTIQVDMHDRLAMALQDDLTTQDRRRRRQGVLIDISSLEIVDSLHRPDDRQHRRHVAHPRRRDRRRRHAAGGGDHAGRARAVADRRPDRPERRTRHGPHPRAARDVRSREDDDAEE